jgi:hypothetical protein
MLRFRFLAAATLCGLLAACATPGPRAPAAGATAAERAKARWTAIVEGRLDLAYDYLTPGTRSTQTRDVYVKQQAAKPVRYKTVTDAVESCEADSCIVGVDLQYEVKIPLAGVGQQTIEATIEERWVRLDGTWYYLPDDLR